MNNHQKAAYRNVLDHFNCTIILIFFWILLLATTFAALMFHLQIVNVEEDYLLDAFGEEYLNYKKKVCRYFGWKFEQKS